MIFVTGASGFVGQALCSLLILRDEELRISVRDKSVGNWPAGVDVIEASLSPEQDWVTVLSGVSSVVHCAARVHVMNETAVEPLAEFRRVNVDGSLRLARQAADAGVRRFVFISSIGVNGGESFAQPFTAEDDVSPHTPYAISKHEAEVALRALAAETGMEVVIIRPPLVYGPGVKANFLAMMRWLECGVPLPLGGLTENRRSLIFIDNLVDLIVTCIDHPAAANQTFLVSDDEEQSTALLLRRIAVALARPARLFHVPTGLIRLGAKLIGQQGVAQSLCGSLWVDNSKAKEMLGWSPLVSVDEGLRRTVAHWIASKQVLRG